MKSKGSLTLVIADDHQVYRDALRAILEENGFRVIGEAADGPDAVQVCRHLEPDIAILDLAMPRLSGMDAAREIKLTHPDIEVILLTIHAEKQYILRSLRAGILGYVTKTKSASTLVEAIDAVCRGETYVRA